MSYIPFPDISPELFSIELFGVTFALRWYALAYIAGLPDRLAAGAAHDPCGAALELRSSDDRGPAGAAADLGDPRRDPRRTAGLRALLPAGPLSRPPARHPEGLGGRHVLPRRLPRSDDGARGLLPEGTHLHPAGGGPSGRRHAAGPLPRADRELHQCRALGPAHDPALGRGLSRRGGAELPRDRGGSAPAIPRRSTRPG